ncbi:hypothetical protein [Pedobacter sp. SYSU D00535]|uniref:hypothetical protein n=1 Tax=Pedobacter sp. SYSU D00535 TaxID=2810308 RepID=UPI001A975861|nr:hypothetical protein [Pedobacter sp. SYSU D00535]
MTNIDLATASRRTGSGEPIAFEITHHSKGGFTLNASVRKITDSDYEVFIKEKEVIVHCTREQNGILSCRLHSKGNPQWLDELGKEVAKRINSIKRL